MTQVGPVRVALVGDTKNLDAALASASAKAGQLGAGIQQRMNAASASVNPLRESFRQLAVQATGVSPSLARIGDVLGTMALGSGPVMLAIGGITALAAAWNHFSGAAREAARASETAIAAALDRARIASLGGPIRAEMGAAMGKRAGLQQRLNDLTAIAANPTTEEDWLNATREIPELREKIANLTGAIEQWGRELAAQRGPASVGGGAGGGAGVAGSIAAAVRSGALAETAEFNRQQAARRAAEIYDALDRPISRRTFDLADMTGGVRVPKTLPAAGKALSDVSDRFAGAAHVAVASFEAMAQAAVSGSGQMHLAITNAIQNIVASIQTKGGGLFGATPWGIAAGLGIGFIGSLFGGGRREPVRVDLNRMSPEAARTMAQAVSERPIHVRNVFITPEGRTIEETEYVLLNREARDGVPRYTGRR